MRAVPLFDLAAELNAARWEALAAPSAGGVGGRRR